MLASVCRHHGTLRVPSSLGSGPAAAAAALPCAAGSLLPGAAPAAALPRARPPSPAALAGSAPPPGALRSAASAAAASAPPAPPPAVSAAAAPAPGAPRSAAAAAAVIQAATRSWHSALGFLPTARCACSTRAALYHTCFGAGCESSATSSASAACSMLLSLSASSTCLSWGCSSRGPCQVSSSALPRSLAFAGACCALAAFGQLACRKATIVTDHALPVRNVICSEHVPTQRQAGRGAVHVFSPRPGVGAPVRWCQARALLPYL